MIHDQDYDLGKALDKASGRPSKTGDEIDFRPTVRRARQEQVALQRIADRAAQDIAPYKEPELPTELPRPKVADPVPDDLAEGATRFADMVARVQASERHLREECTELRARLEQHQGRIEELTGVNDSMRISLDLERAKCIRLSAMIENIGGLIADALREADQS